MRVEIVKTNVPGLPMRIYHDEEPKKKPDDFDPDLIEI